MKHLEVLAALPKLRAEWQVYFDLARTRCIGEQIFLLNDLAARVRIADRALSEEIDLESKYLGSTSELLLMGDRATGADWAALDADAIRMRAELFYWTAHLACTLINAKGRNLKGLRLPGLPIVHARGVAIVRNHIIEHRWHFNGNISSFDGLRRGIQFSGGVTRDSNGSLHSDPGLYVNALEWLSEVSRAFAAGAAKLTHEARRDSPAKP